MSKKKILAAVLFIVIGLFIFAFANPADANEAPVLTLTKDNIIIVKGTDYDLLSIASATDDTDKDLEIKVSIEDTTVLKVGEYDLEYSVTDSDGAKDSETIKLTVLDPNGDEDNDKYTNKEEVEADTNFLDEGSHPDYDAAPTITLGANPTSMEVKGAIPTFIATATDVSDGTIEVVITQTINANVLGTYVITFTATDSLGNTTVKTMNFNVVDTTKPVINVTNTDLDITIEVDLADDIKYTEEFGTITDNYDATKNIVAANVIYSVKNADGTYTTVTSIDTSVVATYRATYSATDANGNMATNVVRTVNVVDTAKPVINVTNTDLDMTIDVDLADDSKYTEEFGTITDNYDATKNIVAANVVYSVKNADDTYTTVTSIDTSVVAMYRAILIQEQQRQIVMMETSQVL